jgi:hypothetical protein
VKARVCVAREWRALGVSASPIAISRSRVGQPAIANAILKASVVVHITKPHIYFIAIQSDNLTSASIVRIRKVHCMPYISSAASSALHHAQEAVHRQQFAVLTLPGLLLFLSLSRVANKNHCAQTNQV